MADVEDPLVRPLRAGLGEIALFSFVFCALACISSLLDSEVQRQGAHGLQTWIRNGGETLGSQVGWFYGTTISLLLGFYAFIGGGQLLGIANARRTQRRLGVVGELLTAATVPPFVILMAWSVISVEHLALMTMLLPAEAVVVFLGGQLGGFVVFDRDERHKAAVQARAESVSTLGRVRTRSRQPAWLVVALHAVAGGGLSFIALWVVVAPASFSAVSPVLIAFVLMALVLNGILFFGSWFYYAATDRFSRALAILMQVGIVATFVLLAVLQNPSEVAPAIDVAVAAQLIVALLSVLAPMSSRVCRDWTVRGAARRFAAAELVRTLARASREARRTRPDPIGSQEAPTSGFAFLRSMLQRS